MAALVGIPFLVSTAARHGDLLNIVGAIVFSASVVALYPSSTVYHGLRNGKAKRVFRVVEHSAIYLFIAGGLSNTVGVIFSALDSRLPFGHLVWHAFVMTGTACHYFSVLRHAG